LKNLLAFTKKLEVKKIKILMLLLNLLIFDSRDGCILKCKFALLRSPSCHVSFIFPWLNSLLSEDDAFGDDVPWVNFEEKKWLHVNTGIKEMYNIILQNGKKNE